ncbi:MAG: hypothetical protein WAO55_08925 [Candidatus Manganitrophaceae bacterium]
MPLILVVVLVWSGCAGPRSLSQLKEMKKDWKEGDYASVAAEKVLCKPSIDGCNQLHLMKGDACFRMAKQGVEPRRHYQCAADHLEEGIHQTREWRLEGLDLNRPQTYENLSESLRQWQDMEKGAEADLLTERLLKTSEAFLQAEPGNPAGIYFQASARLTLLHKALLHPERSPGLCKELNDALNPLLAALPRVGGTRYEPNYHRLRLDIQGAKQAVPGCT